MESKIKKKKVLIASPTYNRAWILPYFIDCIKSMDTSDLDVSFVIFDNMSSDNTEDIVFSKAVGYEYIDTGNLECYDRVLNGSNLLRMQLVREYIRKYTITNGFDYLFCCDSDILVQPNTLKQLMSWGKDFVAATISNSGSLLFLKDACNAKQFKPRLGVYAPKARWLNHIVVGEGLVEVDGTGAVFLVSANMLEKTSYMGKELYVHEGEDYIYARDCMSKGFKQYLDETHRCLHCFKPEILDLYKEQSNKKQAVKILTQRGWLGIPISEKLSNSKNCSYCEKRRAHNEKNKE